MKNVENKML